MSPVNVFDPARLGPVTLPNRFIKSATFEGRSPHGAVTDDLIAFHREVAEGGVGMSTVAYLAVSPEGRTHRHQVLLAEDAVADLRRLTDVIHNAGAAASAQIGHAGPVANAASNRAPAITPSRMLNPLSMRPTRPARPADLARITEDFRRAARCAVESGFDCLEIHIGHDYLLSSFLNPRLNRRKDEWGGALANRARFPREVVRAVRETVGDRAAVIAKFNMTDGVPGGLWLDESLQAARLLDEDGALDAMVLTGGSSLANPLYLFRGEAPIREFARTLPVPVRLPFRLIGKRFMPEYPFQEAYFLPYARQFLAALRTPVILLGGINRLDTAVSAVGEGFAFVAMARALLREPDLVRRMREDSGREGRCVHCNKCMPTIYSSTRCVLRRGS
jgi:2,4-dienoyl-CoA reductase-like NADH-dependent reductase (Old Yellow Enzyme family)